MERDADADTVRGRALDDARGAVIAEGCDYSAAGATHWRIVRSRRGATNQADLEVDGVIQATGCARDLRRWARC